MIRPRLLVSALTDHRPTCREQSLLEALQGSVLSQAVTSWDVQLHIADSVRGCGGNRCGDSPRWPRCPS